MARTLFCLVGTALLLAACSTASPTRTASREERACAEIGIAPGDANYSGCVSMLEASAYTAIPPSGE